MNEQLKKQAIVSTFKLTRTKHSSCCTALSLGYEYLIHKGLLNPTEEEKRAAYNEAKEYYSKVYNHLTIGEIKEYVKIQLVLYSQSILVNNFYLKLRKEGKEIEDLL